MNRVTPLHTLDERSEPCVRDSPFEKALSAPKAMFIAENTFFWFGTHLKLTNILL